MKMNLSLVLATAAFTLVACGGGAGGGGDGGGGASTPAAQAPTVGVKLSQEKVGVGSSAMLSWTSSNASSCVASGAWSGLQASGGSLEVSGSAGGRFTYTLTCKGAGGEATQSATLVVPMPVFKTSYENKNNIPFDATQVTDVAVLGVPKVFPGELNSTERSVAFGDFFQEGRYAAFVSTTRYANLYGSNVETGFPDSPGAAYFLGRRDDGTWFDRSAELLRPGSDRSTCVSPSYSQVADFNNDGRPDVYIACTGLDHPYGLAVPDLLISEQVMFMSQADGSYERTATPYKIYGHRAAVADLNGDGYVDVVNAGGTSFGDAKPFVLMGHGDGTFTRNDTIIPANITDVTGHATNIYQAYLIPIDGRIDLVASGDKTVWFEADATGAFGNARSVTLQQATSTTYGVPYLVPLDLVFDAPRRAFYARVNASHSQGSEWAVLKYDEAGTLLDVSGLWNINPADHLPAGASAQFKPTADGYLVAHTAGCTFPPGQGCTMKVSR